MLVRNVGTIMFYIRPCDSIFDSVYPPIFLVRSFSFNCSFYDVGVKSLILFCLLQNFTWLIILIWKSTGT